jgi:hypothetical protein
LERCGRGEGSSTVQTVRFIARARGDEKRVGRLVEDTVAKVQSPQSIDPNGPAIVAAQRASKSAVARVKRVYSHAESPYGNWHKGMAKQ